MKQFVVILYIIFWTTNTAFAYEILKGKVVCVRDGDTIEILVKKKEIPVRLAGIDAPEKNQAFGQKAKRFTSNKVFRKTAKWWC